MYKLCHNDYSSITISLPITTQYLSVTPPWITQSPWDCCSNHYCVTLPSGLSVCHSNFYIHYFTKLIEIRKIFTDIFGIKVFFSSLSQLAFCLGNCWFRRLSLSSSALSTLGRRFASIFFVWLAFGWLDSIFACLQCHQVSKNPLKTKSLHNYS